jgi:Domain of unknown function (DUF4129)
VIEARHPSSAFGTFSPRGGEKATRVVLVAMMLLIGGTMRAEEPAIPIDRYIATLERIHSLVASNQLSAAQSEAAGLAGQEVLAFGANFHADQSLLESIRLARGADPLLLARIRLTIDELRGSTAPGPAPDPKLLQQVAKEQDVPELTAGGDIETDLVPDTPLAERIGLSIIEMLRWIGRKIVRFVEWIDDLFPDGKRTVRGMTVGMRWIVVGVVTAIVLLIVYLALVVIGRGRKGGPDVVTSAAPARSARDDDPLSRGATEWERYAEQLAGAERFREAIRAWYHAVLVTCYAAGVLHFRKGRTNWEYIASLPPATPWRAEFIRLTERFEQDWYGSLNSSRDAYDDCTAHARAVLDELHQQQRSAA